MRTLTMADVEDLRSASEEEEESEDEQCVRERGVDGPGDRRRRPARRRRCEVLRQVRRRERGAVDDEGEPDAHRHVKNRSDAVSSVGRDETSLGPHRPLSAKLVFSGGATQYASGYCDAGIAVTAPDACIVGRQIERLLETFWRSPVHAVKRSVINQAIRLTDCFAHR